MLPVGVLGLESDMVSILVAIFCFLIGGASIALLWFMGTFKETDAREVPSLVQQFSMRTVLVVLAHPDDEIFITGFLSDIVSRQDCRVVVITASQGRGGDSFGKKEKGKGLAEQRRFEMAAHFAQLRVNEFTVLDFADGGIDKQEEELTTVLASWVIKVQPDTVLTFDPGSGYTGHPDHMAVGRAVVAAVQRNNGAEERLEKKVKNLVYFLVPRRAMNLFGGVRGKIVARNQVEVQFAVNINPALKIRGWKTHVSQSSYLWKVYSIPPWLLYRFFRQEFFSVQKEL